MSTHRGGPLSFVKLDLEGGEFAALRGAEKTLRMFRPCCVFENGLESSASDYNADDFFAYFRDLDYALYNILGCPMHKMRWSRHGPWYLVASPSDSSHQLLPFLWTSALEVLLDSQWSGVHPPPAVFSPRTDAVEAGVIGHVDEVDISVRATGWAGNLHTGQPVASLVAVDGTPAATFSPARARNDVVIATGQVGFTYTGFDVTVRATAGRSVEIYAAAADGTFVKLAGTEVQRIGKIEKVLRSLRR